MLKSPAYRSRSLRDSAHGQACTLQIAGICNCDRETTVLCHLPISTHGMAYKSDDFYAVFGCSACHDVIDGRMLYDWRSGEKEETYLAALHATWRIWFEGELLAAKGGKFT